MINQMGSQRNNNASQFLSQLSDPSHFAPQFFSTPKEDRLGQQGAGAGVQPGGGALPYLVKNQEKMIYYCVCIYQGTGERSAHRKVPACPICLCAWSFAEHLRSSRECVEALKREPLLQMKATGELFIVKTTLLQNGCPAPHCPCPEEGWRHAQIPNQCMLWWREAGWRLMGWHGSGANADSGAIKEKISRFRRNFKQRNKSTSEGSLQEEFSQQNDHATNHISDGINKLRCHFCHAVGPLIPHLHKAKVCLAAYIQQHLPNRAHIYRGQTRLAVFDLGLICNLCPSPDCAGSLSDDALTRHLQSDCLHFYKAEGVRLFNWTQDQSAASIQDKLKHRKSALKTFVADDRDMEPYQRELESVLKFTCSKCSIQGPLMDSEVHKIWGAGMNQNGPCWECSKCRGSDDKHQEMVMHGVERLRELGSCEESGDTLMKVLVQDSDNHTQRVVFLPRFLLLDDDDDLGVEVGDEELNPNSTTVLVPKNPEALTHIGDDATERANQNRKSLEGVAEYFGRRHFYGPIQETLSVFYRLKLAEIRLERLSMLRNLKRTSKGKIISHNPNLADVKDRHPHYAETQRFCFTNTCNWSPAAQEKRSKESAARANINGQVKIKVEVTVLEKLAVDSPVLRDIISGLAANSPFQAALISVAPTVLNFLKVKLRLLVKHIIAPTYSHWDLELRFAKHEWTVKLVGFLYCQEYDELNARIARGEISSKDFTREVTRHQSILPTATLSAQRIMEDYKISKDRAQVRTTDTVNRLISKSEIGSRT